MNLFDSVQGCLVEDSMVSMGFTCVDKNVCVREQGRRRGKTGGDLLRRRNEED